MKTKAERQKEREDQLRADSMVEVINAHLVRCKLCLRSITLSPKMQYDHAHWSMHRKRCLQRLGRWGKSNSKSITRYSRPPAHKSTGIPAKCRSSPELMSCIYSDSSLSTPPSSPRMPLDHSPRPTPASSQSHGRIGSIASQPMILLDRPAFETPSSAMCGPSSVWSLEHALPEPDSEEAHAHREAAMSLYLLHRSP